MHPTLIAMVAAEREADIARAAKRRSHVGSAALPHLRGTSPLAQPSRSIELARALATTKTALAHLVSRPAAAPRTGMAGRDLCCA